MQPVLKSGKLSRSLNESSHRRYTLLFWFVRCKLWPTILHISQRIIEHGLRSNVPSVCFSLSDRAELGRERNKIRKPVVLMQKPPRKPFTENLTFCFLKKKTILLSPSTLSVQMSSFLSWGEGGGRGWGEEGKGLTFRIEIPSWTMSVTISDIWTMSYCFLGEQSSTVIATPLWLRFASMFEIILCLFTKNVHGRQRSRRNLLDVKLSDVKSRYVVFFSFQECSC